MIIDIKVIPGAKKNIVKEEQGNIKVYVTAPADAGKANEAVVVTLAEYFAIKKKDVTILKGLKSRRKTINIDK